MPKSYSYDLRQKVIQAIELDGMKKSEAAQVFQISRNTINLWLQSICQNRRLPSVTKSTTLVMGIKLPTGKNLKNLLRLMGIKLK